MKGNVIVLLALLCLGAPAFGQVAEDRAQTQPPIPVTDKTLREFYAPEDILLAAAPVAVKKPSFAMKHPKLHKAGRRLRRTCQICQPVVSFLGSVGQCVTPFVIH